jgi:hypothetical protein
MKYYSALPIGECGTEVFNPFILISVVGNFINVAILGTAYLLLKMIKWNLKIWKVFGKFFEI